MISWFCHSQDTEDYKSHAIAPVFSEFTENHIEQGKKSGSEIFFNFMHF